jgi:hypothetical protein
LNQLDQHAQGGAGLEEGNLAMCAWARHFVDQLDAFVLQIAQVFAYVRGAETQVMQPRSAAFEKARHGRVCRSRLEQLDEQVGGLNEGNSELSVG